jgi:hypothetical protein
MGIDTQRCELQVQQANTERELDNKISEREVTKLALQLIQLQERTGTEASALKAQVRELEQEKKKDAKARTVFHSTKADLEQQLQVSRGEQARLNLRKETMRRDRVKLNKLFVNGHKRIKEALVKHTRTVETTERVRTFIACFFFFLFCFFVRFANFFPC